MAKDHTAGRHPLMWIVEEV